MEPKAPAWEKGKAGMKEREQRPMKGKALKRRILWVMSASEEGEEEEGKDPMKAMEQREKTAPALDQTPSEKQNARSGLRWTMTKESNLPTSSNKMQGQNGTGDALPKKKRQRVDRRHQS